MKATHSLIIAVFIAFNAIFSSCSNVTKIEDDKLASYLLGSVYVFYADGEQGNALLKQLNDRNPSFTLGQMHEDYNTIMINPYAEASKSQMTKALKEWWDISDKAGLDEMIASLKQGRHSVEFQKIYDSVKNGGGKSAKASDIAKALNVDLDNVQFVINHYDDVSSTGIKSWDYVRAAQLVYYGEGIGFYSEEEGDAILLDLLSIVRKSYNDWNTYFKDFELGRKYWSNSDDEDDYSEIVKLITSDNKGIIFNYIPLNNK